VWNPFIESTNRKTFQIEVMWKTLRLQGEALRRRQHLVLR